MKILWGKICNPQWQSRGGVHCVTLVGTSVRASVRARVNTFKHECLVDSLAFKFHPKRRWGWGKAVLCFESGWIGALVSMATYTSNWVIMGKTVSPRFHGCF